MSVKPPRILVVDDEPYMHRLMEFHLSGAGYIMVSAFSGLEAINAAHEHLPDLIIMDVMMAEMDGLTALKHLKESPETRAIPVIMITANAYHFTREQSESSGAAVYFTKPFSPTRLLMEMRRLIPDRDTSEDE